MEQRIDVIGIGADGPAGLRPEVIERIRRAEFLAGGERHLNYFPEVNSERFVLKDNAMELVKALAKRYLTKRCVVLASGDPLFYGIGGTVAGILGPRWGTHGRETVRIEPALSSMQLAFARAGVPWTGATLASIHGRNLRASLLPLLGETIIGLFTQDGDSPAQVARFFLERGLDNYQAVVGENLGAVNERVTAWADLHQLAEQHFAPLNYLILLGGRTLSVERNRALVPGVPDNLFARPEDEREVMTRQEVRSVVMGKLGGAGNLGDAAWEIGAADNAGVTAWDIGAGLGTVAVEIAVLRPHMEVVAVERDPARTGFLRQNRERFGAYNIRVVEGAAPEALGGESERPRLVFVGGSGGRLADILDLVADRLQGGGRLVASFVTLEHLALALERLRRWQWQVSVTELHVSRSDALAGLTGLKPQRGVFLVSADKPGGRP